MSTWPYPVEFMLCDEPNHDRNKVEKLMKTGDYILQRKYDGIRVQVWYHDGECAIISRNGQNLTNSFPEIVKAFRRNHVDQRNEIGLDGEIVSYDGEFSTVTSRAGTKNTLMTVAMANPCFFACFDVLQLSKANLMGVKSGLVPYHVRKIWRDALEENSVSSPFYVWVQDYTSMDYYDNLCKDDTAEGVVVKRMDGLYVKGRTKEWRKGKFEFMVSCIILDYDSSNHTMTYGLLDKNGDPVIMGTTASGTSKAWQDLWDQIMYKSQLLVEIKCNGLLQGEKGLSFRHPVVHGRRLDISREDCHMGQLDNLPVR